MYCVAVTYIIQAGHEDEAIEYLRRLSAASSSEPDCRMFVAHRSTTEPRRFFLYEQYTDEAAFQAHRTTPHFVEYATNGVYKIIESRVPEFYTNIE